MNSPTGYRVRFLSRVTDTEDTTSIEEDLPVIGHDGYHALVLDEQGVVRTVQDMKRHLADDDGKDGLTVRVSFTVYAS